MANLKELLEARNGVGEQIKAMASEIGAENRVFSAEEQEKWDKLNADYDQLTAQIDVMQRAADVAQRVAQIDALASASARNGPVPGVGDYDGRTAALPTAEQRQAAFAGWCRVAHPDGPTAEQRAAAAFCGLNLNAKELAIPLMDAARLASRQRVFRAYHPSQTGERALSINDGPAGGYLVADTLVPSLEVALLQFGGIRQVAQVIRTTTGGEMTWPASNDTSNTGARIEENTTDTEQDIAFTGKKWFAYKYTSKIIKVPSELLTDSAINIPSLIGSMLGERLGRIMNTEDTTGTGNSQPYGITVAATTGKTTAAADAITFQEIIDHIHSVDPAYRIGAGFMTHDNIIQYLRKLTDGIGQPLWQNGMREGVPDALYGYPITVNQDMASSLTTTYITALFGQLSAYKVRDVGTINLKRLDERYADTDQVAFVALMRHDGNLLDAGTHPVKSLVQYS